MKGINVLVEKAFGAYVPDAKAGLKKEIRAGLESRLIRHSGEKANFKEAKDAFLKNYLKDLLAISHGNISEAAKKAQLHRRHLHRMINRLELSHERPQEKNKILKPTEYLKENFYNILDETLSRTAEIDSVKGIYDYLEDISSVLADNFYPMSYDEAVAYFERCFFENALKENNNDIGKIAEHLQVSERTIYRKINRLNIAMS